VQKRTGREAHGVRIEYEQSRTRHHREGYTAERGETSYEVGPANVGASAQKFVQILGVPAKARNVHFYSDRSGLPEKYQHALQRVR
jgi:hypothetical protein